MNRQFHLNGIDFEWDEVKASANIKKHRIRLEIACEAFFDPFLKPQKDELIDGEFRGTVIGRATDWRLLYVVYVMRSERIRIISARQVTRVERKRYETE